MTLEFTVTVSGGVEGVTAEQLVAAIYVGVPEKLHPVARFSVWAHLRKLGDEGVADSPDPDELGSDWTAASTG